MPFGSMPCEIIMPNGWIDQRKFEIALQQCGNILVDVPDLVVIKFTADCKLLIDVAIRLLSFCNQIMAAGGRLCLDFDPGAYSSIGYLSRMGFFDGLSAKAVVKPTRPRQSGAQRFKGGNSGLVEIERFNSTTKPEQNLVPRLANAVTTACAGRSDVKEIGNMIFNIFGTLIDNVYEHSQTDLDAYAALQTYKNGNQLTLSVSDSGIGIIGSLKPALVAQQSEYGALSDVELLVEIFRQGLTSKPDDKRGLGLKGSARAAIQFQADMDVRLPNQRIVLKPSEGHYTPVMAFSQDHLPLLKGTHISFSFNLA